MRSMKFPDTIFALSSGALPSGVAVIRISGEGCRDAYAALVGGGDPEPRRAFARTLRDDRGSVLDHALVIWFQSPASATGEDVLELQVHGGRATVAAVLERLGSLPGFRLAEPGEFARRGFLNGKFDLTQAEALSELIGAETEAQRKLAMLSQQGAQRRLYEGWRGRVLHARAMIEAELDFADEGDVPGSVAGAVWADVRALAEEMSIHCADFGRAEIVRDGFDIVIIGPPNSGKSSLINALAKRDAAIVTAEPGTTRDLIEVALDVEGYKVRVTDTAGIRETEHEAERIGIRRAIERAERADLVLHLWPAGEMDSEHWDREAPFRDKTLKLVTKIDLGGGSRSEDELGISSKTGEGLDLLLDRIASRVRDTVGTANLLPLRQRHLALLRQAAAALSEADKGHLPLELRAEALRDAGNAIGRITGHVSTEELLGVIFSTFCIGK